MSASEAPPAGVEGCRIGVGLPSAVPGADGGLLVEWARRAEELGFCSLAVLDRVAYPSYDPVSALSAAAAVTSRILLATTIVIPPLRQTALLLKQLGSLSALAPGRVVMGVGTGARGDDYERAGTPWRGRGRRLDRFLDAAVRHFEARGAGEAPLAVPCPTILVGGGGAPAFSRMARWGDGWMFGGGSPAAFASGRASATRAWSALDRPGRPRLWAMGYFALGSAGRGRAYLEDYYAFLGPHAARVLSGNLGTGAQEILRTAKAYADLGCEHLVLFPAVADIGELDRLARVVPRLTRPLSDPVGG
ncbi:LLM class flavin-dependent oxidoreductase [Streptomyces sp. DH37]|uniref:LLM class flavin-dependent oxidoreductase n=1 Tax=Streptomyces sp. DH37 TaxID=3040122 RepID=UPI002441DF8F|nr:LLM class flavin-dependent oxidoreductase [Streptomyces sp. DH37]MDG9701989.1 LLM class flavin-dependent oxidoreductase [Streptomyces sp. DH37]